MRFLIVLALLKCAASYSVIDPSNHKTVSVPIGNGMNVDIDVTVDVNTGGKEECAHFHKRCHSKKHCCKGLKCVFDPWAKRLACVKESTDDGCTLAEDTCETSSECCEYPGTTLTCKESGYGKRCMNAKDQKCHANEGEGCAYDDDCCEEDNICAGEWRYRREEFTQKCQLKPEQCSANKGEECLSDHDCCEKDHVCIVIMKEKRSYCGLKDDGVNDHCTDAGEKCKTDSECCDDAIKMTCQSVAGINRCMPDLPKCNANEGEYCTKDEDCCEKDNACEADVAGVRPTCTYKPNDCIADGEPCHGTDDWVHECCSESCCEGKCGTCGYTPWYKRS